MGTSQPMPLYVGTKTLHAQPMTRGAYNSYRGWEVTADENPEDEGYLVEYTDGGKANDARHVGYISWSPKDVFERTYKPVNAAPSGLPAYQGRVVAEKAELDERLGLLLAFFGSPTFEALPEVERVRLRCQSLFMTGYSAVLGERIKAFKA